MRRTLIISAAALLLGIGAFVYFFFFTGGADVVVAPEGSGLPLAGQQQGPGTQTAGDTPTSSVGTPTAVSSRLVKISAGPVVSGAVVVAKAKNASSSPEAVVSYIERQSGNIFSYNTGTKTLTRISNKTVPGIVSALWLPDASLAFVRYLSGSDFSTINTFALPASGSGAVPAGRQGFFLSQNLVDIALSPANILTLASGVNGSVASLARTDGTRSAALFTTPLSSLRVSFAGKNQYLVFTKPSATLPGDAFLVDAAGRFSRIAGPSTGLAALASPLGKWVLVSYTLDGSMQMSLINTVTGESLPLPVATVIDKCVWAADDSVIYCGIPVNPPAGVDYPDDWYQGAVHFSDRIWKIQITGRYANLVLDFSNETKESLDAESLAIDQSNTTLVFKNKNDGSLWAYSL